MLDSESTKDPCILTNGETEENQKKNAVWPTAESIGFGTA